MSLKKYDEHTITSFVRQSVEKTAITEQVINGIMPYFPKGDQVIGGFVNETKQYWKANFHWEYLLFHLDKASEMKIDKKYKKCISAVKAVLVKNKPSPDSGYMKSKVMGQPADLSARSTVIARWATIKQCKKDFKSIINASNLLKGMSRKRQKVWLLSVAPVARPGTSKHSTGYAVDIYGNNHRIQDVSKKLKASLVFPEGSHVHVEFKNGVAGEPFKNVPAAMAQANGSHGTHHVDDMCLLSPLELAELKLAVSSAAATGDFSEVVSYLNVLGDILDDVVESWW